MPKRTVYRILSGVAMVFHPEKKDIGVLVKNTDTITPKKFSSPIHNTEYYLNESSDDNYSTLKPADAMKILYFQ